MKRPHRAVRHTAHRGARHVAHRAAKRVHRVARRVVRHRALRVNIAEPTYTGWIADVDDPSDRWYSGFPYWDSVDLRGELGRAPIQGDDDNCVDVALASLVRSPEPLATGATTLREGLRALGLPALRVCAQDLLSALSDGRPVAFGYEVQDAKGHPLGGHAAVIVAYDAVKDRYLVRTGWSKPLAHLWYDAEYIENPALAGDFWVIV